MTRERAEEIIHSLKEFGVVSPMAIAMDGGPMLWYCPPGDAEGSEGQSCRSTFFGISVTMWPKLHDYIFYEGQDHGPSYVPRMARHHLWAQEYRVYLLERSTALSRAMEEMDKLLPIPRLDPNTINDPAPYPEDFGIFASTNQMAAEAIEKWLREVPIGTT